MHKRYKFLIKLVLSLICLAFAISLFSCGPSREELEKRERERRDSLAKGFSPTEPKISSVTDNYEHGLKIVKADGHEYVVYVNGGICHHAGCKGFH
jgi:hypothetical protein